ncbi:MAG: type II toxin-antitoxin system VapC family toxin [Desulfobacteria bacterium]
MTTPKIIIDTNIVSYLMRGGHEAKVYTSHLRGKLIAISFVTVGELYYGAEKGNWGQKKRLQLETVLKNYVVIPYDHEIAKQYGKVLVERQRLGRPISFNDAWIAACAIRHGTPLITHNSKDFESISGLQIITEKITVE